MPLYGPHGQSEGGGQGVHPGPADAVLVGGVVRQGAVRADQYAGAPARRNRTIFGMRVKVRLAAKNLLLGFPRRVRSGDSWWYDSPKRRALGKRNAPPLFLCRFLTAPP